MEPEPSMGKQIASRRCKVDLRSGQQAKVVAEVAVPDPPIVIDTVGAFAEGSMAGESIWIELGTKVGLVIDLGNATDDCKDKIKERAKRFHDDGRDVRLVITHWHEDHAGGCAKVPKTQRDRWHLYHGLCHIDLSHRLGTGKHSTKAIVDTIGTVEALKSPPCYGGTKTKCVSSDAGWGTELSERQRTFVGSAPLVVKLDAKTCGITEEEHGLKAFDVVVTIYNPLLMAGRERTFNFSTDGPQENITSLVVVLEATWTTRQDKKGTFSYLSLGDLDRSVPFDIGRQRRIADEQPVVVDVLKLPHHGNYDDFKNAVGAATLPGRKDRVQATHYVFSGNKPDGGQSTIKHILVAEAGEGERDNNNNNNNNEGAKGSAGVKAWSGRYLVGLDNTDLNLLMANVHRTTIDLGVVKPVEHFTFGRDERIRVRPGLGSYESSIYDCFRKNTTSGRAPEPTIVRRAHRLDQK